MKYYYGFFSDVNKQLYKVVVKCDTKRDEVIMQPELLLSDPPFLVNYEGQENLFEPHKCSTATIRLLNKEYNADFNEDAEVLLLRLKKGETYFDDLKMPSADGRFFDIEWCGFSTPNAYSQGYSSYYDEFELECQDKLSILGYTEMPDYRESLVITPDIDYVTKTLQDLLKEIETELGLKIYITNNIRLPKTASLYEELNKDSILNLTFDISSFINDDEPKKYMEVVDDIMTSFKLTILQIKDKIYIVDYDAIAYGYNTFVDTDSNACRFESDVVVDASKSAGNSNNLSLIENYSKFSATCNYYETEVKLPDLSDWSNRIVYDIEDSDTENESALQYMYYDKVRKETDGTTTYLYRYERAEHNPLQGLARVGFFGINFDNIKDAFVTGYAYMQEYTAWANPDAFVPGPVLNYDLGDMVLNFNLRKCYAKDCIVATPCSIDVADFKRSYSYVPTVDVCESPEYGYMLYHNANYPSVLSNTEREWYKNNALSQKVAREQKLLTFAKRWFSPKAKDRYLYISCDMTCYPDLLPTPWVDPLKMTMPDIDRDMNFIWVTISVFDNQGWWYYDIDTRTWISDLAQPTRLYFGGGNGNGAFFNKQSLENQCTEAKGFAKGIKGIAIKISDEIETITAIKIDIYRPWGINNVRKTVATFIQDLEFGITSTDKEMKMAVDSNLTVNSEYKNISKFLSEKAVDLNYCTYKAGAACNNILFNTVYQKRCNLDYVSSIATGDVMKPEYLVVNGYRRQYSKPSLVLSISSHDDYNMLSKVTYRRFKDKKFVVNGISYDYRYNIREVQIYEKK